MIWDRQWPPGTPRVTLDEWEHNLGVQGPGLMELLGVIGGVKHWAELGRTCQVHFGDQLRITWGTTEYKVVV